METLAKKIRNRFDVEKEGHILFGVTKRNDDDGKLYPRNVCCTKTHDERTQVLEATPFESNPFEIYISSWQNYDFHFPTKDNKICNTLINTTIKDKDGNEIEAPDKLIPYMKALAPYPYVMITTFFLYAERETFAIANPNVNLWSPSDIIGFDEDRMFYYCDGLNEITEVSGLKFLD